MLYSCWCSKTAFDWLSSLALRSLEAVSEELDQSINDAGELLSSKPGGISVLGCSISGIKTSPDNMAPLIHVLNIWLKLGSINGIKISSCGSGCSIIIIIAKAVRGPHSLK